MNIRKLAATIKCINSDILKILRKMNIRKLATTVKCFFSNFSNIVWDSDTCQMCFIIFIGKECLITYFGNWSVEFYDASSVRICI